MCITKLRLSNIKFQIETGRWRKIPIANRLFWHTFLANQHLHTIDTIHKTKSNFIKVDFTNSIHLKPCVPLMFIIYNKRAIFDDNLLDDISLFQKVEFCSGKYVKVIIISVI
jgi:uncharacterized protein YjbI with pentapeptide repeats